MVGGDCFAPAGGPRRGVDPGGGGLRPKSTAVPSPLQVHPWKRRPLTLRQYVHRCVVTHAGVVDAARTRLDRISDTRERGDKSHAIRSPSGPAASKQRPLSYRNRWSSVPAQQSPSLERAYRPRSRNAHFFRCSVRGARGSAAAQSWATPPTLCKCTACQIWWLGMACGLRWVASYKN